MRTQPRHPVVETYLVDLQRAAARLSRAQREELLAEISAHVDAAATAAQSEADIRNMLDDLGPPSEIVDAASPRPAEAGPTGRLALALGVVALLLSPVFGIPAGVAAAILGLRARRYLRHAGRTSGRATAAVVTGFVAAALQILLVSGLIAARTEGDADEPARPATTETTILGG